MAGLAIALGLALAGAQPAAAQQAQPEDDRRYTDDVLRRERVLSGEIMSPFCPGRTMISCTSDQARTYREAFKGYLANGVSEGEIKRQFENVIRQQFGPQAADLTRSTPRGALAWSIPALVLAAGAGALAYTLRRLRGAGSASAAAAPAAPSRELEAELDRQLKSRGL